MKPASFLAICVWFLSFEAMQDLGRQDLVQIRLIESSFHRGVIRMTDDRSKRPLYLAAEPLFCMRDVDSAWAHSNFDSRGIRCYDVIIWFKRTLRDSMYRVTRRHLLRRIAIIVDGELTTPTIMNPIRDPVITVSKSTDQQARGLARRINETLRRR